MKKLDIYHKSVLVREVVEYINPQPGKTYIDATFGGGGHTRALLQAQPECNILAFDWDRNALDTNAPAIAQDFPDRVRFIWGSFGHMTQLLKKESITQVDGILADFGTSQYQIGSAEGFSFAIDTPLDMRMSPGHYKVTAADIVNRASEEELATILYDYGEEHASRKIARAIVHYRNHVEPLWTTKQLAELIKKTIPAAGRRIHPATKTFQALRIVVNDELNNIKSLLTQSLDLLAPHGRLVCISFHSLEDRIVKQFIKEHAAILENLTKKVVTAASDEIEVNKSSRSAKLRAAQKRA